MKLYAHANGDVIEMELDADRDAVAAQIGPKRHAIVLDDLKTSIRTAFLDHRRIEFGWTREDDEYVILIEGIEYRIAVHDARGEKATKFRRKAAADTGDTEVKAPIPGLISKVLVAEGDKVKKDQPLMTLDAMKLENEIGSPKDGTVKSIAVKAGSKVDKGQTLVVVA
ncbi:MAG TPA: acetyl-CoA carboxylase biotin carboxyl carrier protein subunit [Planctomycetota bacterium]|nr:acetyl-CoA carboxylase biotin carboxyl carrier protein subunit [Planctomycetota bacterium]